MLKRDGIALIAVLGLLVIIGGLIALIGTRMVNEIQTDGDDIAIVQTLALARGGANLGGILLNGPVQTSLDGVIDNLSRVTNNGSRWTFDVDNTQGDTPDPANVATDLGNVAANLQAILDANLCNQTTAVGAGTVNVRVHMTLQPICNGTQALPPGVQLPEGRYVSGNPRDGRGSLSVQTYAVPFALVSEGRVGDYERQVVIQGEYHIQVGAGSFARYALFTNQHQSPQGNDIWFTNNTLFDGPVHTNNFFRFFEQPWFGGEVTSASCIQPNAANCGNRGSNPGAEFWNQGFVPSRNMNNPQRPSFTDRDRRGRVTRTHEPDFVDGVNWNAGYIELPQNNIDQRNAARGVGEPHAGLFIGRDAEVLEMWAADANGDPLTRDRSGNWVPDATFQYIRECSDAAELNCTTYRYRENNNSATDLFPELEVFQGGDPNDPASWNVQENEFNGMIFVDGDVERLRGPQRTPANSADADLAPPALASFATINVTADSDVRITRDLTYESPPCAGSPTRNADNTVTAADCDNLDARNVLGVFTPNGDVLIGHANQDQTMNAPSNLTVHGVLMSSSGAVTVENFRVNDGVNRGSMRLLGGMIENFYGGFGTFDNRTGTMRTGYSRQFTYDRRMAGGLAPPFFPTIGEEAIRNTILFSFGQREQIN